MIKPTASFPVFIVPDVNAAQTYFTEHFDFSPVFANDWYVHLLSGAGIQIGFMLPDQPTQPEFLHAAHPGKGTIFSLEVEDADAAYSEAKEKGLNIVLDLRSEDWGQRHFILEDPNGLHLDIAQNIQPSEEYQENYVEE